VAARAWGGGAKQEARARSDRRPSSAVPNTPRRPRGHPPAPGVRPMPKRRAGGSLIPRFFLAPAGRWISLENRFFGTPIFSPRRNPLPPRWEWILRGYVDPDVVWPWVQANRPGFGNPCNRIRAFKSPEPLNTLRTYASLRTLSILSILPQP